MQIDLAHQIAQNVAENRFELKLDGHIAVLEYIERRSKIIFTHTGVPPEHKGRGVGAALAQHALEYAREKRLSVIPLCPFVAAYMRRNPQYLDLLDPGIAV